MDKNPRVLSIQSHVVSGYVGNKSATFPLQVLGFEVDAINSVQFSNHTGYKLFKGQVLTDQDLDDLLTGLEENNLDFYSHLLTGYVGSLSFLTRIKSLVQHLKSINPDIIYVCDPVMGDNGKMYVPQELLPIYKDIILLADIITPNQYEVELLTGLKIENVTDAWKAINMLHEKGCKTIAVSSTDLGNGENLLALASSIKNGIKCAITIDIPKFTVHFTGTGDLFSSLLLAWMYKSNNDIKISIEKTIATLQIVLKKTIEYSTKYHENHTVKSTELKLIQCKNEIENPVISIHVRDVSN